MILLTELVLNLEVILPIMTIVTLCSIALALRLYWNLKVYRLKVLAFLVKNNCIDFDKSMRNPQHIEDAPLRFVKQSERMKLKSLEELEMKEKLTIQEDYEDQ